VAAVEPNFKIADLATVWLMLEIFPTDAALVRYAQQVEAEVQPLLFDINATKVVVRMTTNRYQDLACLVAKQRWFFT
jgi:hypothetical protein